MPSVRSSDAPAPAKGGAGILKSAAVVGAMTMLSRVLGLAREQLMAHFFGISALKSAFDVAFTVPNLFRRLFGEGALSSAFIPVFGETARRKSAAEAFAFGARVLTLLFCALGLIVAVAVAAAFALERVAPEGSAWPATLPLARIMLPYALLLCLAALLSGMLNSFGRFAVSSFTPLILNMVWIGAIFAAARFCGGDSPEAEMRRLEVVAWSVVAAGFLQFAFQLPALFRLGFRFALRLKGIFADEKIRRVLRLMAPAALGMGLVQVNVCVDKVLALWAADYAPAALEYAERIIYLPLGVFATAFTTVLLPAFTTMAAADEKAEIGEEAERAFRNLFFVMIPGTFIVLLLAEPLVHLLYSFKGGAFARDPDASLLAGRALACYAPGLAVFCAQKVLAPVYYAFQDVKTPLKISMGCLVLNVVLNVVSVMLLPDGWKHTGIAGSTVVCSAVNGFFLFALLKRHGVRVRVKGVAAAALRFAAAAAPTAFAARWAWLSLPRLSGFVRIAPDGLPESKGAEAAAAACAFAAAAAVYFALVAVFSRKDAAAAFSAIRRRRRPRAGR